MYFILSYKSFISHSSSSLICIDTWSVRSHSLRLSVCPQHVPGVQPEGAGRHVGSLHQPAERLPHHQGGAETLQDEGGRGEGEGGHRQAGLAGHQPQPQQPQTQRPLHQTQHCPEEDAGLARGPHQWSGYRRNPSSHLIDAKSIIFFNVYMPIVFPSCHRFPLHISSRRQSGHFVQQHQARHLSALRWGDDHRPALPPQGTASWPAGRQPRAACLSHLES